ncbi:MAG TPA: apolipoprotein N-acyltransferase [Candidatus Acidoferrales bacterium]|nr:apolipoprotein N-acyltransferase [Candidatus Acidoferrales bacterium]
MPPTPDQNIPLAVDLDGTLIRTDMMWESLAQLLRRNVFAIFQILFWWTRGRAYLKQKLAARVKIDPATLPYNEKFLAWLHEEKKSGRKLILATASDLKMTQPIADHVGLFDEVLASNGAVNLRSENKLRALTEKFGARGFDYAGNSSADYAVWRGSRQAVVVNASPGVLKQAAGCTTFGPVFCENFSHLAVARSVCNELFWRSGYLFAIVAGLLLACAFPKLSLAGFAWVAPALLMFAATGKSRYDAFCVGYLAGFTFWLASLYWLLFIPVTGLPILGWILLAAYLALFTGTWTWLITHRSSPDTLSWTRRVLWTLSAAAAWVALEMIRARFLGGFPWSFLGVSQYQLVPLIQLASITGVYGVSFLVVWFSLALFCAAQMILKNPAKRHGWQAEIVLPLVVVILCFTAGLFRMNHAVAAQDSMRVTLIQPGIPQTVMWDPRENERSFRQFLALNEAALTNEPDLVVWPESAVPEMSEENCRTISAFARQHHVWLILNGEDVSTSKTETNYFNAAFLVNPQGELTRTYHKQKLVIFGEYVPLVHWLPFLQWFTPIVGGWTEGTNSVTFPLDGLNLQSRTGSDATNKVITIGSATPPRHSAKTAVLICFEDSFAPVTREAAQDDLDFLINLTNDGWFGDTSEQWQHMANSVFRCVENGLPLLRCSNNGITCSINGYGRVETIFRNAKNNEYQAGVLTLEVPLLQPSEKSAATFYNRHGDWFGWGCVGVAGLLLCRKMFTHYR